MNKSILITGEAGFADHDLKYALDSNKMRWEPLISFEESLAKTVKWVAGPKNNRWINL